MAILFIALKFCGHIEWTRYLYSRSSEPFATLNVKLPSPTLRKLSVR
jgi:hypothetical protein